MYGFVHKAINWFRIKNLGLNSEERSRSADASGANQSEETIHSLARFPSENPNPVLRFSIHNKVFIYNNNPGKWALLN